MSWKDLASEIKWNITPFIDGRYHPSNSSQLIDNINPATELLLCRFAIGDASDIDEAVQVARQRFEDGCWSNLSPEHRAATLARLADLIAEHKSELALLDTLEMGKPIQAALYDAGHIAPGLLRSWAGFADKLLGSSAPLSSRVLSFNTFEPRGVIGAVTPWNFPSVNAVVKFGPALAAGNSVVLKPSEISPSSALRIAELALEAGLPDGVFNVVPGTGSTVGAALARHPDVDLISFTGSTATGRKVMELAGSSNGKPLLLECGGKSPQLVFDDVENLGSVADVIVQSVLWNQGQVCSAHTRLIVHEAVKNALTDEVLRRAREQHPGDPLDDATTFGPLASPAQRDRVNAYVVRGIQSGARALLRGKVQESGGCNVAPTIFDQVQSTMSIAREEIFGPVLCIQSFSTDDEALELANATDYGLEATVWTRDIRRGRRFARQVRAGTITIRSSAADVPLSGCQLSCEPQKASGFGCEVGLRALESYSTLKLINVIGD